MFPFSTLAVGSRTAVVIYASPGVDATADASTLRTRGAEVGDWLISITWNGKHKLGGTSLATAYQHFRQLVAADLDSVMSWTDASDAAQPGAYWIVRGPVSVNNSVASGVRSGSPTVTSGYTRNAKWLGHFAVCRFFGQNAAALSNAVTSPTHVNGVRVNENVVGRTITGQLMLSAAVYGEGDFTWGDGPSTTDASDDLTVFEFRGVQ